MLSLLLAAALASAAPAPTIAVPRGRISVAFEKFPRAASDDAVLKFVARSAEPVSAYYGRFPVPRLTVEVVPNTRNQTGLFGREFHGRRISFYLGAAADADRLKDDQILTHEMFHLGFPDLARDYAWIEEGLATYLAHLCRARLGQTTEAELWLDARDGFGDAQPKPGDGGLADAENYRRMYWGGALFWLEVDLEIRQRSEGKRSLDTVTRALLASGGTNAHKWSLSRLRRAVDKAAGFPIFRKWYDLFGPKPMQVDLEALWKKLGLRFEGKNVALQENPLRAALLKNLP